MTIIPKLSELTLKQRSEIFSVLRVEITHHSNKMEGIKLEYGETKRLLEEGITAPNKPLSDHLILIGFANAYDDILRTAYSNDKLTTDYIKDIHLLIFDEALRVCPGKVERPIGAYRQDERHIRGINIDLSSPMKIKDDLENLLYKDSPKTIDEIASFHIDFERIHPFADGNGRVGRLIMTKQFIENDLIPPLIKNDVRKDYLKAMNDNKELSNLLKTAQMESFKIIKKDFKEEKIVNSLKSLVQEAKEEDRELGH